MAAAVMEIGEMSLVTLKCHARLNNMIAHNIIYMEVYACACAHTHTHTHTHTYTHTHTQTHTPHKHTHTYKHTHHTNTHTNTHTSYDIIIIRRLSRR